MFKNRQKIEKTGNSNSSINNQISKSKHLRTGSLDLNLPKISNKIKTLDNFSRNKKKFKANSMLDIETYEDIEKENLNEMKQRDINQVKKLDYWDNSHIKPKEKNEKVKSNRKLPFYSQRESINYLNEIKQNLVNFKNNENNSLLNDFSKKEIFGKFFIF